MRQTLKQTPSAAGSCDWSRSPYAALVNDALVNDCECCAAEQHVMLSVREEEEEEESPPRRQTAGSLFSIAAFWFQFDRSWELRRDDIENVSVWWFVITLTAARDIKLSGSRTVLQCSSLMSLQSSSSACWKSVESVCVWVDKYIYLFDSGDTICSCRDTSLRSRIELHRPEKIHFPLFVLAAGDEVILPGESCYSHQTVGVSRCRYMLQEHPDCRSLNSRPLVLNGQKSTFNLWDKEINA